MQYIEEKDNVRYAQNTNISSKTQTFLHYCKIAPVLGETNIIISITYLEEA